MKKPVRTVLIILAAVVIVLAVLSGAYIWKFSAETKVMSPLPTGRPVKGVCAVNNEFVNFYLLGGGKNYIAIDAGNDPELTKGEITKLGIDTAAVKAIFLTHTDADHVAAVELFPNAKIYLSKAEEQMVNGATGRFLMFGNSLPREHALLDDGGVVAVGGFRVKGISTPGHTPGSMSYLVNDTLLFSGDTLSLHDGKVEPFNEFFNMDTGREKDSIRILARLKGLQYIFTGHYGYTADPDKAFAGVASSLRSAQ